MRNEYLKHTIATINYRFLKDAKDNFGNFNLGKGSRSADEIINHMYFVLSSTTLYILEEREQKELPEKLNLSLEIDRFNLELKNLEKVLSENELGMS